MTDYFSIPKVSFSSLKEIDRSPAHFKHAKENPKEQTAAMKFGSAVHCKVLEPQEFDKRYICAPEYDGRTKEGKAIKAEFEALAGGKEVLKNDVYKSVCDVADIVLASEEIKKIIAQGKAEVALEGVIDGVEMKGRLDFVAPSFILDVKTTTNADPKNRGFDSFQKTIANRHYDAQAYIYQELNRQATGRKLPYIILAIENEAPYGFSLFHLPEAWIEVGQKKVQKWLALYKECVKSGEWPAYEKKIIQLEIPSWVVNSFLE